MYVGDLDIIKGTDVVKYLVIGGYAVSVHAQPRVTKDLDIFILPAPDNVKAIFKALAEFGAPLSTRTSRDADPTTPRRALTAKDFEDTNKWFTFGVQPVAVDILPKIPGVTFNADSIMTGIVFDTETTSLVAARTGDDMQASARARRIDHGNTGPDR